MATIIINSYGWLTLNLLFTILPAKNDTTHKKKKNACAFKMHADRSSSSGISLLETIRNDVHEEYYKWGELSEAALFSLTLPMIVSVSAKWMYAS